MSLDILWRTWIGWIVWIVAMKQAKDLHILYPNMNHSNAVFLQTEYDVPLWDKEGPFFHPNSSLNWLTSVQWKPHERIPADDCQQVSRKLCDTITVSYFWNLPSTDPCYPAGESTRLCTVIKETLVEICHHRDFMLICPGWAGFIFADKYVYTYTRWDAVLQHVDCAIPVCVPSAVPV